MTGENTSFTPGDVVSGLEPSELVEIADKAEEAEEQGFDLNKIPQSKFPGIIFIYE